MQNLGKYIKMNKHEYKIEFLSVYPEILDSKCLNTDKINNPISD